MRANAPELLALLREKFPEVEGFDLPAALFALARVESNFEIDAVGKIGERGILQVHPGWFPQLGEYPENDLAAQLEWARPVVSNLMLRMGNISGALAAAGNVSFDEDRVGYWPCFAWQLKPSTLAKAVQGSGSADANDWLDVLYPLGAANAAKRNAQRNRLSLYASLFDQVAHKAAHGFQAIEESAEAWADRFARAVELVATAELVATPLFFGALFVGALVFAAEYFFGGHKK